MPPPTMPDAPRSSRLPVIVGIAVIGLAIIATLLLLAVLDPGEQPAAGASGDPSPPATASAAASTARATPAPATAAASASISAMPSASASATASDIARPREILPIGAVLRVTGDGLRIRELPSTTGEVVATVNAGALLYVGAPADPILPPRVADGYEWYPVIHAPGYDGWPVDPPVDDRSDGWVAARSASGSFVELAPPDCPNGVPDIADVVALTPYERVACLGDGTLSLDGTFGCPFCDSLTYPIGMEPDWLASWPLHLNMLVPSWGVYPPFPGSIVLATPPGTGPFDPEARGRVLRVTGHFDDARSADCTIAPEPGYGTIEPVHDEAAEWYCRERFVVESWEIIGTDPGYEALLPG